MRLSTFVTPPNELFFTAGDSVQRHLKISNFFLEKKNALVWRSAATGLGKRNPNRLARIRAIIGIHRANRTLYM